MTEMYVQAQRQYAKVGVDCDLALAKLKEIPISIPCWQGDDVTGFDQITSLSGEFRQQETILEKREHHRN